MLLDSNIIIYATQPQYVTLRAFIASITPTVSAVSYVEVLGYYRLTPEEKEFLEDFFAAKEILPVWQRLIAGQWSMTRARHSE